MSMARLNDVVGILKFGRIVGQTVFGHFDHDASSAIGPDLELTEQDDQATPEIAQDRVHLESWDDPQTGEELVRIKSSQRT